MFVILRTNPEPDGYFKKKKFRKKLIKSNVIAVQTKRGLPFFIVDIPEKMSVLHWKLTAEKCGRYASRTVAPRCLALPDSAGLQRFTPKHTGSFITFNTAIEIIKKSEINPSDFSVTLTDRNAVCPQKALSLLPISSTVRIITLHPEKYASVCKKALDEYGASIIIRSAYEAVTKPDIVICCDGGISPEMFDSAIFFCGHTSVGKLNFQLSRIALLNSHSEIIPDNIEPGDFVGAITELCGSSEYKKSSFCDIITDCSKCENSSPELCLKCFVTNL